MPEKLRLGETLRYPRYTKKTAHLIDHEFISDCPHRNFYYVSSATYRRDKPARLEQGIFAMEDVRGADRVVRCPAILIRSSPAKAGSRLTPWHDSIDVTKGNALYYGDKKSHDEFAFAHQPRGNRRLLAQSVLHMSRSRSDRLSAAPLLFFTTRRLEGMSNGHVRLEGLGVISKSELVSQLDPDGTPFPNYRFESQFISLAAEGELLDWAWLDGRRRPDMSLEDTLRLAPSAWRRWVEEGSPSIGAVRRRLALGLTRKPKEQLPDPGTIENDVLSEILRFYAKREHRFEALASLIASERMSGGAYVPGWVSPAGSDGGYDFVGRLDVGHVAAPVPLIVLGQAKCRGRNAGASAEDLARLVARLRRGWFGVFVTTSYVTETAQVELQRDEYPLMLVSGREVAETVRLLALAETGGSVRSYLEFVDARYESMVSDLDPTEVLRR